MSGHRPFRELTQGLTAAQAARVDAKAAALRSKMSMADIRRSLGLTQADVARLLDVQQSNVAKLERKPDLKISGLRDYVQSLGGELRLVAHFPEADVTLTNFAAPAAQD